MLIEVSVVFFSVSDMAFHFRSFQGKYKKFLTRMDKEFIVLN